jgi:hypothetical protein
MTLSKALAAVFACAPLMFGANRLVTTGDDYRMLAMAVVSLIGFFIVVSVKRDTRPSTAAIFFVSTVLAATVAYVMGARAAFGIWAVATVFGFCYASSNILKQRSTKPV